MLLEELIWLSTSVEELVFVKMDGTINEVEDINIGGFPTVLAFSKTDKTPIDLSSKVL